jgi:hypothetical protein
MTIYLRRIKMFEGGYGEMSVQEVFALRRKVTGLSLKSSLAVLISLMIRLPFMPVASGASGWTDMRGPGNGGANALAYDATNGILYRGTNSRGIWRYQGGAWTDLNIGNRNISCLVYDSAHNILYASSQGVYRVDTPSIMVTPKTAGKKIMVERAMYWENRGAGTDTIGGYSD